MIPKTLPDWVRVLVVLRRQPKRWAVSSVLRELLAMGHAVPEGWGGGEIPDPSARILWRATDKGLKSLAVWETINGPAEDEARRKSRPAPGVAAVMSWAKVVSTFPRNAPEVREELEGVCNGCDQVRTDESGNWCGACGCGVSAYDRTIFNLASFAEPPGVRLCKHPKRGEVNPSTGKAYGWPLPVLQPADVAKIVAQAEPAVMNLLSRKKG